MTRTPGTNEPAPEAGTGSLAGECRGPGSRRARRRIHVRNFGSYDKTYGSIAEANALIEHRSPEGKREGAKSQADAFAVGVLLGRRGESA